MAGVGYDFALTYGQETGRRTGYDTVVSRLQLALRGFGSLAGDTTGGCTAWLSAWYQPNSPNASSPLSNA